MMGGNGCSILKRRRVDSPDAAVPTGDTSAAHVRRRLWCRPIATVDGPGQMRQVEVMIGEPMPLSPYQVVKMNSFQTWKHEKLRVLKRQKQSVMMRPNGRLVRVATMERYLHREDGLRCLEELDETEDVVGLGEDEVESASGTQETNVPEASAIETISGNGRRSPKTSLLRGKSLSNIKLYDDAWESTTTSSSSRRWPSGTSGEKERSMDIAMRSYERLKSLNSLT